MDEEERIRKDEYDLVQIDRLLNNDEFTGYYLRRLHEKRENLADEILTNDVLSPEERERKRFLYNEIGKLISLPESDKAAIRSHLNT